MTLEFLVKSSMKQAEEILEAASTQSGKPLPRFNSRETVPAFLWKLSEWLGWRPELRGESREVKLRDIARRMEMPRGSGGHAKTVDLEDPERIRSWILLFVYVAFMGRSVFDFAHDLDVENTERTIDVKSESICTEECDLYGGVAG